jgi:NitT/TauT family transport system substrate-binding protein
LSVGTWETAQTIQPFVYEQFLPADWKVQIHPFTNPADQKTAFLAGSLEMTGTTMAHAIRFATQGQSFVFLAVADAVKPRFWFAAKGFQKKTKRY